MRLYLAHPLDTREKVRSVELQLEKKLKISLINPFYDVERHDIVEIDAGRKERYENLDFVSLVEHDLAMVKACDGVLAYISEGAFSVGTICEAWWCATITGKPVYFVSEHHHQHPWVRFMAYCSKGKLFRTFEEFGEFVKTHVKR